MRWTASDWTEESCACRWRSTVDLPRRGNGAGEIAVGLVRGPGLDPAIVTAAVAVATAGRGPGRIPATRLDLRNAKASVLDRGRAPVRRETTRAIVVRWKRIARNSEAKLMARRCADPGLGLDQLLAPVPGLELNPIPHLKVAT
jgi:hypothetical protein